MIPSPWILLGGLLAFIGAATGGYFYGDHHRATIDQAALLQERAAATKAASDFAAQSAAKDAANAETTRNLEQAHATALAAADATRADFAERLRDATRKARSGCVPAAAVDPGKPKNDAAGSNAGRGSTDPGLRLRDVIKVLQADVQLCVASWAQAGR